MINITAAQVKELRNLTGVGMMDCKRALTIANGDINLAINNMHKSGQVKAAKKINRVAAEGIILTKVDGNTAAIVELNCETDFVAKDMSFKAFGEKVINQVITKKITDITLLQTKFEKQRVDLVIKTGENIYIRRIAILTDAVLGQYLHHNARIGAIVAVKGADLELAKQVAIHIVASHPRYLTPENVSKEDVELEYQLQLSQVLEFKKPPEITKKILEGRMKKFIYRISLTSQAFYADANKTMGQILGNANVINFKRYEVGEGIEKP
ncbi:translation elongation factor Ts [Candidatus Fukatsuia anoeciicola]|uniref:translation elongation factor Ts n=1 Tax=Candidatus Fukatsuia anoeciicola TaxID=2994492 RepID=UPI0034641193